LFYTHRIDSGPPEQHAVEHCLAICQALGCGRQPVEFGFHVTGEDRAAVDRMLQGLGPFALLLPGTNWPTKRWPVEKYAALVEPLRQRFGLASVAGGGPDALELAAGIGADRNLAGRTSLRQLVALLERADLVIANDSGPMHIASALARPLVTIFGPTNPLRTGPYGRLDTVTRLPLPCSPCYARRCSHTSCMNWLEIESVLDAAAEALKLTIALKDTGLSVR
jgi:ADP-heptose:LPS heptosyltransferase